MGRMPALSGSALKAAALAAMTAGHAVQTVLPQALAAAGHPVPGAMSAALLAVSRIAFPVFCFMLAEGLAHTRDARRYALRLLAAACASEIPFDLASSGAPFDPSHQNVMFELALCAAALHLGGRLRARAADGIGGWCAFSTAVLAAALAADALRLDYGSVGVLSACAFHVLRGRRLAPAAGCAPPALMHPAALLAAPLLMLYDGSRGRLPKLLFYVYYPAHLLALWALASAIGACA